MTSRVKEVKKDNELLALFIPNDFELGTKFFSPAQEMIQVGRICCDLGKEFKAHRHKPRPRTVPHTQEVMVLISGSLNCNIYDMNKEFIDSFILSPGDLGVFFNGGHEYQSLSDNTFVYEIKHGPFLSVEVDKEYI